MSTEQKLRIFFHPIDATGHIFASVGLAQRLQEHGHKIIFLVDYSLRKKFTPFGFEERYVHKLGGAKSKEHDQSEHLGRKLLESGILSDCPPLEKLDHCLKFGLLHSVARNCDDYDPQVAANLAIERPDLIVVDNMFIEPAILKSSIPLVTLYSGNPLPLYQTDRLPPFGLGLPTDERNEEWPDLYRQVKQVFYEPIKALQARLQGKVIDRQTTTTEVSLLCRSKNLTIYGYPSELDYHDIVPRPADLFRLDTLSRRPSDEVFKLPADFPTEGSLIYFTLGSMGGADKELMMRLVNILATTPHRYIVSIGHSNLELPASMFGSRFLPQVDLLPLVDLVICHGGNNTVTESIAAGKACLILPYFSDGYDNAQRLTEKQFGARLDPYCCTAEELSSTIERLLADEEMRARLVDVSARIERDDRASIEQLSELLESITKLKV